MTRPRQISDQELLTVAREAFIENGASVSTSTIAERAGISQAVLFQRFKTKERLLLAALAQHKEPPYFKRARGGPDGRDIRTQLYELAEAIATHFERIIPEIMVLRSAGICVENLFEGDKPPPPIRGYRCMLAWFKAARAQGRIADVDPSAAAMAFAGSIQTRIFLTHIGGEQFVTDSLSTYLNSLIELFWQGLRPSEEP